MIPPKVEVTWIDSITHGGWGDASLALEHEVANCKSVGYVLKKDEVTLSLIQSISDDNDQVSELICIPIVAIQEIVELVRVDDRDNQ